MLSASMSGSGAILTEVPKRMFPKKADAMKLAGRIPPIIISAQELRELKIVKDPGHDTSAMSPLLGRAHPVTQFGLHLSLVPLYTLQTSVSFTGVTPRRGGQTST